MQELGYYNGEYGPLSEMKVPMTDRVAVFGDGVYDAAMARNGKIFALPEHIDRIFNGMAELKINPPCSKQEMADTLLEMLGKVDESEVFVYWQVTRGTARRSHTFDPNMESNFWIMIFPDKADPLDREFSAITHEDTRFLHCNVKNAELDSVRAVCAGCKGSGCRRGHPVSVGRLCDGMRPFERAYPEGRRADHAPGG